MLAQPVLGYVFGRSTERLHENATPENALRVSYRGDTADLDFLMVTAQTEKAPLADMNVTSTDTYVGRQKEPRNA